MYYHPTDDTNQPCFRNVNIVAVHIKYVLGPCVHIQCVPCVGTQTVQPVNSTGRRRRLCRNECSDIEAELMRQGGRLPELLIVRESDSTGRN